LRTSTSIESTNKTKNLHRITEKGRKYKANPPAEIKAEEGTATSPVTKTVTKTVLPQPPTPEEKETEVEPAITSQSDIFRSVAEQLILTLADVERNNGHKPFTEAMMYRIASRRVADYWREHYKLTNGLTCCSCSKAQRRKCKEDDLYSECPKAIKLESLDKPILDGEGNLTTLGELIADDKALDLDGWVSSSTWELGYPKRLVAVAYRLKAGIPLTKTDRQYLWRFRKAEQKTLLPM
jgi:hypothetical protein